ncbi:MAG: hypothetical protein FWF97_02350 [Alphaproteobacteria bacterium]|nr:hypothetical protein [Alphaproteobacteria bacterium]
MTKPKLRIILDLNGVVQEHYSKQFKRFAKEEIAAGRLTWFDFAIMAVKLKLKNHSLTPKQEGFMKRFYETDQHIKTPFLPDAVQDVKQLLKDYPVHICSANDYSPESNERYKKFLTKTFGKFASIDFVPPFTSKFGFYKEIQEKYPNDEFIVMDDSPNHIKEAEEAGLWRFKIDKKIGITVCPVR